MILITGAAGFIGSCMVAYLQEQGAGKLILVDDFSIEKKQPNFQHRKVVQLVPRSELFSWLSTHKPELEGVIHLGARTDTTEFDWEIFQQLNLDYSKQIWSYCTEHQIPLVYASSAATYGEGEQGFADETDRISHLKPLNPYGQSKQDFDLWVLKQSTHPPFWAGLKFFNVYGPNENHKGRMASVIFHAFHQIQQTGGMRLFRSHRADYQDGEQRRDFIYVKDLVRVIAFLLDKQPASDIYNLGTGQARTFWDLTLATFAAMDMPANIRFIDIPADIRERYQYFTEANMEKLRAAGYTADFTSLEEGVGEYVKSFLMPGKIW